jgi:DNA-binding HxlR family transcriptional regulator
VKWEDIGHSQCSVARSSAVLGDRWVLVILSDIFLGVRRFDDFHQRLAIPRTTLANRLARLVEHGVLDRSLYQSAPERYEYRLTAKGRDLYPVISTIVNWGDKYYCVADEPPIIRRHKHCGHDVLPVLTCPECDQRIDAYSMDARKRRSVEGIPDVVRGPVSN